MDPKRSQPPYPTQPGYPINPMQQAYPNNPTQSVNFSQPACPIQPSFPVQPNPNMTGYATQNTPGYPNQPAFASQPGYTPMVGFAGKQMPPTYPQGNANPPPYTVNVVENQPGFHAETLPEVEGQKPGDNLPDNFEESFSTRAIRHRFVRKVYLILTSQLLLTLGIVALFSLHEGVQTFVRQHSWTIYLSYAVFIVTYITLICCSSVRRSWPGNFIMLFIFTMAMSYLLGAISSFYATEIVIFSVGVTALICFLITLFAIQTKIDFTGSGIYLCVASWVLFIFGITALVMRHPTMNLLYSAGIVLLFSMYLIFDTQRIIGGRKHDLSAEEHITGALVLYIDVVQIFLGILGMSRS